jgi:hypothetical protein
MEGKNMSATKEQIEAGALALHARNGFTPWKKVTEPAREAYRSDAKAVIEAGERVAGQPIETADDMVKALARIRELETENNRLLDENELAEDELKSTRELLDSLDVPGATLAADHVRNLIAMFNQMKDRAETAEAHACDNELAAGALESIHELLDYGGVPRGTFADDHVRNLVAMFNQMKDRAEKAEAERDASRQTRSAILERECDATRAATIERCALLAEGAQFAALDAETGDRIAEAIRALKPAQGLRPAAETDTATTIIFSATNEDEKIIEAATEAPPECR